jgi:hypothetical protein
MNQRELPIRVFVYMKDRVNRMLAILASATTLAFKIAQPPSPTPVNMLRLAVVCLLCFLQHSLHRVLRESWIFALNASICVQVKLPRKYGHLLMVTAGISKSPLESSPRNLQVQQPNSHDQKGKDIDNMMVEPPSESCSCRFCNEKEA